MTPRVTDDAERWRDEWDGIDVAPANDLPWTEGSTSAPRLRGKAEDEPRTLPKLGSILDGAIRRIVRRAQGHEKPIALPWPSLHPQFGGGLWPGLHVINSGTGVGKTQMALQIAERAAKADVPVLYIGLEMNDFDIGARMLGNAAKIPWSALWTGQVDPRHLDKLATVLPELLELKFHPRFSRPNGYTPADIEADVRAMRAMYPETDGPGSQPILVIVDYLQIIGSGATSDQEARARVGGAAGVLRGLASQSGVSVLCISSIARERYKLLSNIRHEAKLAWELDPQGYPVDRYVNDRDAIVGIGKESGEIEFFADSVTVLALAPETRDGKHIDVVVATPKGRATGALWSVLHFNGTTYSEPEDRGGRLIDAWEESDTARETKRAEKRAAREQAKVDEASEDAERVEAFVRRNPGCTVRTARAECVGSDRRWNAAKRILGGRLVLKDGLRIVDDA